MVLLFRGAYMQLNKKKRKKILTCHPDYLTAAMCWELKFVRGTKWVRFVTPKHIKQVVNLLVQSGLKI